MANDNNKMKLFVNAPERSHIDLSHEKLTTMDYGLLYPVFTQLCLPTDQISVNVRSLIKMSPLFRKVFGRCNLDLHAFFVPNRVIWSDWTTYWTGQNPTATPPAISMSQLYAGIVNDNAKFSIFSELGYPVNAKQDFTQSVNCLRLRAYERIWWDYFRNDTLIPETSKDSYLYTNGGTISNPQFKNEFVPRYRTWRKDIVTTALPSPNAPDYGKLSSLFQYGSAGNAMINSTRSYNPQNSNTRNDTGGDSVQWLRSAVALQRFAERMNVTGSRAISKLRSIFNASATPERLDMAEFIGHQTIPLNIGEVVANHEQSNTEVYGTSAFTVDSSIGSCGFANAVGGGNGQSSDFNYTAQEHGYFMIIASIMPEVQYGQYLEPDLCYGVNSLNNDYTDYFLPDFDNIGYQPLFAKNVYLPYGDQTIANWEPNRVFGYIPRYGEYRSARNKICGNFLRPDTRVALEGFSWLRDLSELDTDATHIVASYPHIADFTKEDRENYDGRFQISDASFDHFISNFYFVVDMNRPMKNLGLPTELTGQSGNVIEVANGGVRI